MKTKPNDSEDDDAVSDRPELPLPTTSTESQTSSDETLPPEEQLFVRAVNDLLALRGDEPVARFVGEFSADQLHAARGARLEAAKSRKIV